MPSAVQEDTDRVQGRGEEGDGEGFEAAVEGRRDLEIGARLVYAATQHGIFSLRRHVSGHIRLLSTNRGRQTDFDRSWQTD